MRWNEIISEAKAPKDHVIIWTNDDDTRTVIEIGGRILTDHDHGFQHTLKGINLKNVRSPHGPLLFHGSVRTIDHFHDMSWFSAEPYTAITHAEFWKGLGHGKDAYIYVCSARLTSPLVNPDMVPGHEKSGDVERLYKANPNADSLLWKDTKDVIMPKTDLYNIKSGNSVTILKKWTIETNTVSDEDLDNIAAGGEPGAPIPEPRRPNTPWLVTNPGLTPFEEGSYITQDEYEQFGDHLEAKKVPQ